MASARTKSNLKMWSKRKRLRIKFLQAKHFAQLFCLVVFWEISTLYYGTEQPRGSIRASCQVIPDSNLGAPKKYWKWTFKPCSERCCLVSERHQIDPQPPQPPKKALFEIALRPSAIEHPSTLLSSILHKVATTNYYGKMLRCDLNNVFIGSQN